MSGRSSGFRSRTRASAGQRDLRANLDNEREIITCDAQGILYLAREHLVANLDIGEGLVIERVEQK